MKHTFVAFAGCTRLVRVNTRYKDKLIFDFSTDAGSLAYLDKKEFEIKNVWFRDEFDELAQSNREL